MTGNGDPADARCYEGVVTLQPDGIVLRAYVDIGPVAPVDGPGDPVVSDAGDGGDLVLALSGLRVDGRECLLSTVLRYGEGFDVEVVESSLSPFATLDDVIAFQRQGRQVSMVIEYVAEDIDEESISVAGGFSVDGRRWTFAGDLPRVRRTSRVQRAMTADNGAKPGALH